VNGDQNKRVLNPTTTRSSRRARLRTLRTDGAQSAPATLRPPERLKQGKRKKVKVKTKGMLFVLTFTFFLFLFH
jgi:hypothetical protein